MQAIILAAGVGNRLGALGARPKALLEFGGETLIARHLRVLAAHAVTKVTLCVGYQAEALMDAAVFAASEVTCIQNTDFITH